jgi:NADH-quinone oxidoreductase subunit M
MNIFECWVIVLIGIPAVVAAITATHIAVERARGIATGAGLAMLAWAALPFLEGELIRSMSASEVVSPFFGVRSLLRIDALSRPLPCLAAALWLLSVAVTPRTSLDRGGLVRAAAATMFTTLGFLTENPGLLVFVWTASVLTFSFALSSGGHQRARRVVMAYLGMSTLAFGFGVALAFGSEKGGVMELAGLWLIVLAAVTRKGVFPFHAWLPAVFEHGKIGPAVLFSTPQFGTYVVAVLVLPRASPDTISTLAAFALVTGVYGGMLALVQRSARRACGYLFMSQSALVMAGLDIANPEGLTGALVLWISSSLAFAGLARCVLVLEARRGTLDLSKYHGGYENKPLLAAAFLLLGLTCAGFPGTLGFVGEELLLAGSLQDFPVLGFLVVIAGALIGLAIMRMYFSLFCGTRASVLRLELTRREAIGFASVVGFLLLTGLAPGPLVASRLEASFHLRPGSFEPHASRVTRPALAPSGHPNKATGDDDDSGDDASRVEPKGEFWHSGGDSNPLGHCARGCPSGWKPEPI